MWRLEMEVRCGVRWWRIDLSVRGGGGWSWWLRWWRFEQKV